MALLNKTQWMIELAASVTAGSNSAHGFSPDWAGEFVEVSSRGRRIFAHILKVNEDGLAVLAGFDVAGDLPLRER